MPDLMPSMASLRDAAAVAPAGYALAFHIRYAAPTFLLQAYPKAWTAYYSLHALVMSDPTVAWGFTHEGTCRWSDLEDDPARVMERAADHGLKYGVVCAVESDGSRSFGSYARADREFTDAEARTLYRTLVDLHDATRNLSELSPASIEELRKMSVNYAKG